MHVFLVSIFTTVEKITLRCMDNWIALSSLRTTLTVVTELANTGRFMRFQMYSQTILDIF
jgi:hypothetical protein